VSDRPISSPRELRDELERLGERAGDAAFLESHAGEADLSVTDDDSQFEPVDFIAEMMSGGYPHGAQVEIYGYEFCNQSIEENVWSVHSGDGERVIAGLNLAAFRTASEVETFLLEEVHDRRERSEDE
jgi:hypothetical protein